METKNAAVKTTENQRGKKPQELSVNLQHWLYVTSLSQVISNFEFE